MSVAYLGALAQDLPQSCSHFKAVLGKIYFLAYLVVGYRRIHFLIGCWTETSVPQELLATDLL